jgi:hypothetical protein
MNELMKQAALHWLTKEQLLSQDDAEKCYEDVDLHEGTMLDFAEQYLQEQIDNGIVVIPEKLALYYQPDAKSFAYDLQASGDAREFECAGKTWVCVQ